MKKTITINLGGMVFHIDEDAYRLLEQYLRSVEVHYSGDPSAPEILEDIETRMAELFSEKTGTRKEVIILADAEEVIRIMGHPENFIEEDPAPSHQQAGRSRYRRIYRDPDNNILGGVCSGLGAYFNIDPLLFRLVFIGITLLGGAGILLYLILWIIVPEAKTTAQKLEMRGEPVNVSNIGKKVKEDTAG